MHSALSLLALATVVVLGCFDASTEPLSTPAGAAAAVDTTDAREPDIMSTDSTAVLKWCFDLLKDVATSTTSEGERDALGKLGDFHYERAVRTGAITYSTTLAAVDANGDAVSFGSSWQDRTASVTLGACGTTIEYRPIEAANLEVFMRE